MRLIIISGRSGSGKTIALNALEDLGFYCIDNLPVSFLPNLEEQVGRHHSSVAVSIDIRNAPIEPLEFKALLDNLNLAKKNCEIVYLDAEEKILLHRFSETRRKHPLSDLKTTLKEAIQKEKEVLTPIAALANLMIDTSQKTPQELYQFIRDRIVHHNKEKIQLTLLSFGFKKGLPTDSDFIFDVRSLPNPYWQPELRNLCGLDEPVIQYLQSIPQSQELLNDIVHFLVKWIPSFESDNRSYITISIGCTGGQHRSVYFVQQIAKQLQKSFKNLQIRHRELKPKTLIETD